MFTVTKLQSANVRIGLNWAVVRTAYSGTTSIYAFCKTQSAARKVADALNATATVALSA